MAATENYSPAREMYAELNRRQNMRWVETNGKDALIIRESFGYALRLGQVEAFVEGVVSGLVFTYAQVERLRGKVRDDGRLLADLYFGLLKDAGSLLRPEYAFSINVGLFLSACQDLQVHDRFLTALQDPLWGVGLSRRQDGTTMRAQWELYDEVILRIREASASASVKAEGKKRRETAGQNLDGAIAYVDQCFHVYPRLFVQRMDLGYQFLLPHRDPERVTLHGVGRLKQDFASLTKRLSQDPRYAGIVGYLAKVEYGQHKGYLMHAVWLCDGRPRKAAQHWARLIGDLWVQGVTGGDGVFHDCNAETFHDGYRAGVGLIDKDNYRKRVALEQWVVRYVTQSSLFLKVTVGKRERTYFRGALRA